MMHSKQCKLSKINILIFFLSVFKCINGFCVSSMPPTCIENIEDEEAMEKLNYVLGKYEEIEQKIVGEPISVTGKRITINNMEEIHIDFRYKDNTDYDIIQVCSFVIINAVDACETISTTCNSYSARTPRPILMRKALNVCDGNVEEVIEVTEVVMDYETEQSVDNTTTESLVNANELAVK